MDIIKKTQVFYQRFKGQKFCVCKTLAGAKVYCVKVVKTARPVIICQYSMHAREYITTYLALKQIKDFEKKGICGTVYFLPMVNPDGVEIALYRNPLYKANYNGVDLNLNFDALWGKGLSNSNKKGSDNYIGPYPFSEIESRALRDFTKKIMPDLTVSYHAKGEEIYYEFHKTGRVLDKSLIAARVVSGCTGYKIKKIVGSCGGYKDWCIDKLNVPSITVEVGKDSLSHPLKENCLKDIYKKNKNVLFNLTSEKNLWN